MKELLKLVDTSLTYHTKNGETEALRKINLTINEGEFVAIVGPSGCGKTTILSLISGIIKATSGKIILDDEEITSPSKNVGYMFQRDHLFEWRTILKNVNLGLELNKNTSHEQEEYVLNLLTKYGLIDFKNSYPRELSGGMRQRVALIRTLALNPKLLLLDEPFSALDYQTRLKVCDDVSNIIHSEGKTAILVTHDLSEAISMADRIIVLTKRPAQIKKEFVINLKSYGAPLKRRESPDFPILFDKIWKELQDEE